MKKFLNENNVTVQEFRLLKEKLVGTIFTIHQWNNRYGGKTPINNVERAYIKNVLDEIRKGGKK